MKTEKVLPPHSKESEMMVLGCALSSQTHLRIVCERMDDSDFHFAEHKTIFRVLKRFYDSEKPADIHLLCEELKKLDKLKAIGGPAYLTTLAQYAGTSAYIEQYTEELKTLRSKRDFLNTVHELSEEAQSNAIDLDQVLDLAQQRLSKIGKNISQENVATIGNILTEKRKQKNSYLEKLQSRWEVFSKTGKPHIPGIPTGFTALDELATVLENTHLVIVAGRPSMGKTAFALNIAANLCFEQSMEVAIFSLEMDSEQLAERLLAIDTGVPIQSLKRGTLKEKDFLRVMDASKRLQDSPLFIHEHNCASVSQLVSRARQLKEKQNIRLLIIDYLQLLSSGGRHDSRQYEIADISRRLKMLAQELEIPIICLAQLSRKVEDRQDKRPLLSDLRDSGGIEQDADVVLFLYRRDYYDPMDKPGAAEVKVAKNRHGACGTVDLAFKKETGKFQNLDPLSCETPANEMGLNSVNKTKNGSFAWMVLNHRRSM